MNTDRDVDRGEKRNFDSFDHGGGRGGGGDNANSNGDYGVEEEEEEDEDGFQFIYAQGDSSYYKHKIVIGTVVKN